MGDVRRYRQARDKLMRRLSAAEMLKDEGNDKFSEGEYADALDEYEYALNLFDYEMANLCRDQEVGTRPLDTVHAALGYKCMQLWDTGTPRACSFGVLGSAQGEPPGEPQRSPEDPHTLAERW